MAKRERVSITVDRDDVLQLTAWAAVGLIEPVPALRRLFSLAQYELTAADEAELQRRIARLTASAWEEMENTTATRPR